MTKTLSNNKRIAKNTLLLYFRTILIMAITLYTSRVVLNTLGVENYGIHNVVGGVVAMFSVISGSLSSSISRFITFELGHGDSNKLKRIFSTSVNIQIFISLLILLLGETIGLWFLNYKMNIPTERLEAANIVLQCSLLSFIINLISIPYNACIIAHERMSAFAYISILEVSLKLAIVYMLLISPFDKLSTYAILLVIVAILIRFTYSIYCRKNFAESKYQMIYDKSLLREMTGFAGWSFLGNGAYILNVQGIDMLINVFFGVSLNAARGISTQVQNAIMQFVNNFTIAINPQITKSYAANDMDYVFKLVCRGAKYSYFMLLLFVVPIASESFYILKIWLKIVPEYAPIFLQLTLFGSLITILGNSMLTAITANGNIKQYQIYVTLVGCLVFPLTWIAFELKMPVYTTYIIYIVIYYLLHFIRLYFIKKIMNFPISIFIKEVLLKTLLVTIMSFVSPILIIQLIPSSFIRFLTICLICTLSNILIIHHFGLDKAERSYIINKIVHFLKKKNKNE